LFRYGEGIIDFDAGVALDMHRAGAAQRHATAEFRGTDGLQTRRWREPDSNLYGAFSVK
jgi:hypothetical protein